MRADAQSPRATGRSPRRRRSASASTRRSGAAPALRSMRAESAASTPPAPSCCSISPATREGDHRPRRRAARALVDAVAKAQTTAVAKPPPKDTGIVALLARTGAAVENIWDDSVALVGFIGLILATIARVLAASAALARDVALFPHRADRARRGADRGAAQLSRRRGRRVPRRDGAARFRRERVHGRARRLFVPARVRRAA